MTITPKVPTGSSPGETPGGLESDVHTSSSSLSSPPSNIVQCPQTSNAPAISSSSPVVTCSAPAEVVQPLDINYGRMFKRMLTDNYHLFNCVDISSIKSSYIRVIHDVLDVCMANFLLTILGCCYTFQPFEGGILLLKSKATK